MHAKGIPVDLLWPKRGHRREARKDMGGLVSGFECEIAKLIDRMRKWYECIGKLGTGINGNIQMSEPVRTVFQVLLVLEPVVRLRSTQVFTRAPRVTLIGSARSLASRPDPPKRSLPRTGAPRALPTAEYYPSMYNIYQLTTDRSRCMTNCTMMICFLSRAKFRSGISDPSLTLPLLRPQPPLNLMHNVYLPIGHPFGSHYLYGKRN